MHQSPKGWEAGRWEMRVQFPTDSALVFILGSQRQDSQPSRREQLNDLNRSPPFPEQH